MAIVMRDYAQAKGTLNNMNAFLPKEYKVKINTKEYIKKIQTKMIVVCNFCKQEINRNDIKILNVLKSLQVSLEDDYEKLWRCPQCKEYNKLFETRFIRESLDLPYYLKMVAEPPVQRDGMESRRTFHNKFTNWFYNYLEELDFQLGLYRTEYISQFALSQLEPMVMDDTPAS